MNMQQIQLIKEFEDGTVALFPQSIEYFKSQDEIDREIRISINLVDYKITQQLASMKSLFLFISKEDNKRMNDYLDSLYRIRYLVEKQVHSEIERFSI